MTIFLPSPEEQRAINHVLRELKDHNRLYTEDGNHNEQGQADMAVGRLIDSGFNPASNNLKPKLYTQQELKTLYKLAYRLSKDDEDHTLEESYSKDKLGMLTSANRLFNLQDHKDPLTKKEYYEYKAENYSSYFEHWLKVRLKRIWYKFLSKVTRQNDTEQQI